MSEDSDGEKKKPSWMIGTPLYEDDEGDDENSKKKNKNAYVPIYKQEVTDEQGRRRLHGAFTGGFSAGYFNTVGSKEGWAPSTFVSTRGKRADRSAARPEDFMDDEDREQLGVGPKNLVTKGNFDILGPTAAESSKKKPDASIIPGPMPDELIVPVRDTMGIQLLKTMGWRPGQGIGPKKARRILPAAAGDDDAEGDGDIAALAPGFLFAPKDVAVVEITPKNDFYGLGFDPHANAPEFAEVRRSRAEAIREAPSKPFRVSFSAALTGKAGPASGFGLGAFEDADDLDVYGGDNPNKYDIELDIPMRHKKKEPLRLTSGKDSSQRDTDGVPMLKGFRFAAKQPDPPKWFPPPELPRGYVPKAPFATIPTPLVPEQKPPGSESRSGPQGARPPPLSSEQRGRILGETPLPHPQKSVFEMMTAADKERLVKLVTQISSSRTGIMALQAYKENPAKQARYEIFLSEVAGKAPDGAYLSAAQGMTEWEKEHERDEFTKAAVFFTRPTSDAIASRFITASSSDLPTATPGVSSGSGSGSAPEKPTEKPQASTPQELAALNNQYGRLTRTVEEWRPAKLLCKRFNVPDPYAGQAVPLAKKRFTVMDVEAPFPVAGIGQSSSSAMADTTQTGPGSTPGVTSSTEGAKVDGASAVAAQKNAQANVQVKSQVGAQRGAPVQSFGSGAKRNDVSLDSDDEVEYALPPGKRDGQAEVQSARVVRPPIDIFKAIFEDDSDEEEGGAPNESVNEASPEPSAEVASAVSTSLPNGKEPSTAIGQNRTASEGIVLRPVTSSESSLEPASASSISMRPVFRPQKRSRWETEPSGEGSAEASLSSKSEKPETKVSASSSRVASREASRTGMAFAEVAGEAWEERAIERSGERHQVAKAAVKPSSVSSRLAGASERSGEGEASGSALHTRSDAEPSADASGARSGADSSQIIRSITGGSRLGGDLSGEPSAAQAGEAAAAGAGQSVKKQGHLELTKKDEKTPNERPGKAAAPSSGSESESKSESPSEAEEQETGKEMKDESRLEDDDGQKDGKEVKGTARDMARTRRKEKKRSSEKHKDRDEERKEGKEKKRRKKDKDKDSDDEMRKKKHRKRRAKERDTDEEKREQRRKKAKGNDGDRKKEKKRRNEEDEDGEDEGQGRRRSEKDEKVKDMRRRKGESETKDDRERRSKEERRRKKEEKKRRREEKRRKRGEGTKGRDKDKERAISEDSSGSDSGSEVESELERKLRDFRSGPAVGKGHNANRERDVVGQGHVDVPKERDVTRCDVSKHRDITTSRGSGDTDWRESTVRDVPEDRPKDRDITRTQAQRDVTKERGGRSADGADSKQVLHRRRAADFM